MPTVLNLVLYFVLVYILYYSLPLFFVHVTCFNHTIIAYVQRGPITKSTMY